MHDPRSHRRPDRREQGPAGRRVALVAAGALLAALTASTGAIAQETSPAGESAWPPATCAGEPPALLEPGQTIAPDPGASPATSSTEPLPPGPLAAGPVLTSAFAPSLAFEVGDGWTLDLETRDFIGLTDTTGPGRYLSIASIVGVIDPTADGRALAPIDLAAGADVDCLAAALTAHPWLTVVPDAEPQALASLDGWSMDLVVGAPEDGPLAGAPLLPLLGLSVEPGPADRLGVAPGSTIRVAWARLPDGPKPALVVVAEAPDPDGLAGFEPTVEAIIDSITLTDG